VTIYYYNNLHTIQSYKKNVTYLAKLSQSKDINKHNNTNNYITYRKRALGTQTNRERERVKINR